MATITFNKSNHWIQLGVGDILVDAQEIADAIRTYEEDLNNFDLDTMMDAVGKGAIGGTDFTGILLTLLDGWKIRADDTFGSATTVVVKGDIITDVADESPFIPVTNVSYDRGLSTAPSISVVSAGGVNFFRSLDR